MTTQEAAAQLGYALPLPCWQLKVEKVTYDSRYQKDENEPMPIAA